VLWEKEESTIAGSKLFGLNQRRMTDPLFAGGDFYQPSRSTAAASLSSNQPVFKAADSFSDVDIG